MKRHPKIVPRRFTAEGEDPGVAYQVRDGAVDTDKPHRVKGRALSEVWLDYVHRQPCLFVSHRCSGSIEAHHYGKRGRGQKSSDFLTAAVCTYHHREFHNSGRCKPFTPDATKASIREWGGEHLAAFIEARQ